MASSEIARLKQKFEQKKPSLSGLGLAPGAPPPRATPAFHEMRAREERKSQLDAAKRARQQAARYNLTLRALALSSAKKATDERARILDEVARARALASQYNATARALRVGVNGVSKKGFPASLTIRTKISEGDELCSQASPAPVTQPATVAIGLQAENTETKTDDTDDATVESKAEDVDEKKITKKVTFATSEPYVATEPTLEGSTSTTSEEDKESDDEKRITEAFSMPEVEKALKEGKEEVINEVLIRTFLEAVDPDRAKDASKLLEEYQGKEEELMHSLLENSAPEYEKEDRSAESFVEVPDEPEKLGFITSANVDSTTREVTLSTVDNAQIEAFKSKLLARGMSELQIEKMVDETSEML